VPSTFYLVNGNTKLSVLTLRQANRWASVFRSWPKRTPIGCRRRRRRADPDRLAQALKQRPVACLARPRPARDEPWPAPFASSRRTPTTRSKSSSRVAFRGKSNGLETLRLGWPAAPEPPGRFPRPASSEKYNPRPEIWPGHFWWV